MKGEKGLFLAIVWALIDWVSIVLCVQVGLIVETDAVLLSMLTFVLLGALISLVVFLDEE